MLAKWMSLECLCLSRSFSRIHLAHFNGKYISEITTNSGGDKSFNYIVIYSLAVPLFWLVLLSSSMAL
jgi:hypothetical protein